ncbi:TetR/AcrR family transcriptional regulator [Clostridium sp. D2Q-11]|uniref:TetR/AcrR family transcriptional regulator n=1 Tax=Anaeromonas frigoriresistens TaxID=2683708 RepID=A0A942ZA66_9FIRM|nr:TetR/AcrR family transcriptional regulator [Anaeromonas frigoriresistens]MBS4539510.1 TetR/AcrR family transcriptional regulator [Anaeromonas frigoriresistens]
MGIKERKEREKNEKRELILKAANEIIKEEGIEKVSIRKIAKKIEYSPPIVYHYFKNKEDIINQLMIKGYGKILKSISIEDKSMMNPEDRLRKTIKKYIYSSLENSEEYKNLLLSDSTNILEHTSILYKGVSQDRKAMEMLVDVLKKIYIGKNIQSKELELVAQSIWVSMFGLIIRLIIEKDIGEDQRKRLIDSHVEFIMNGIYS